jgi:uncharacterized protein (UPF0548 family)
VSTARTRPAWPVWEVPDAVPLGLAAVRFRRAELSAVVGRGDDAFRRAADDVLHWRVKTRSGFVVDDTEPVEEGRRVRVVVPVGVGPLVLARIVEPVEVVEVVELPERVGFAYRTLPGHPVSGEEAFVVHRDGDEVVLTIRSLTRPAPSGVWRLLFPVLLIAQRVVRRRYLRALRVAD